MSSRIKPAIVSRTVIVCTPEKIGGQNEHAAIVTRVHPDNVIDVTLLLSGRRRALSGRRRSSR